MLSRAVKLTIKYFDGRIPAPGEYEALDLELRDQALASIALMCSAVENMKIDRGIDSVMNVVRAANRYMEKTAPWTLAKEGNMTRLATVLYTAAETLRIVSGLLLPVMPCIRYRPVPRRAEEARTSRGNRGKIRFRRPPRKMGDA